MRKKGAPDQTPTGWSHSVEVEKQEVMSAPYSVNEGGLEAYRSRTRELWRGGGDQWTLNRWHALLH